MPARDSAGLCPCGVLPTFLPILLAKGSAGRRLTTRKWQRPNPGKRNYRA